MKTLLHYLIAIVVLMATGSAWADPPVTQPAVEPTVQRPNYTRYYIHAVGEGTLLVHSCLTPTRFSVKTDEKTAVIGMDGKAGTLCDLRLGQWVKFRREGNENQRVAVIEIVSDSIQGTIIDAPGEDGIFNVQPQGTKAPCAGMKIATDPKTVITVAEEKVNVADLKAGMWVRAEMVGDVATRIVAGHLWLEDGERLVLFKGLPEEFFTHPAGFDVNNVPTKFGPLRMIYRLTGNGSYLRWGRKALPKNGMVVCWPTTLKARFSYGQPVKPDDQGLIHLPADVSELRIWFVDQVVPQKSTLAFDTPVPPERSVQQRIEARRFPSVFQAWNPAQNVQDESPLHTMARHDLLWQGSQFFGLRWNNKHVGLADGFDTESIERARAFRRRLLGLNPNLVLLVEIRYRDAHKSYLPEGHPWWLRDTQGRIVSGWEEGGFLCLDFHNPEFRHQVAKQAKAAVASGAVDGVMLDWWSDDADRLALVNEIRQAIGDQALIICNANDRITPQTAPFINGYFMECYRTKTVEDWKRIADTLVWAEKNLRSPRVNCVETWFHKSRDDLNLMRATTTLALTLSNGYCLFSDPNPLPTPDHLHNWYPFWNKSLGRPVSAGAAAADGTVRREFDGGTVIYNPMRNRDVTIRFSQPRTSVATGRTGTEHQLANPDGDIYLTPKPRFMLGADISWVQQQEDEGICFTDHGNLQDLLAILKEHGFNWIRLRIFHDPKADKGYSKKGYCDLDHTLAMAKRIKATGMRFLLDFHYSDTWADPGHQAKPVAWKDLHGVELEKAVHDHTRNVVAALKQQGTSPDMVQIGNEISNGFLWPDGNVWKSGKWDVFCGLIKAGIAGAREVDPSVKIMIHLAWGGQNAQSRSFVDKALAQGVDFDIIGQSYYPKWHGTLDDLKANLTDLAGRYKQDIIVVEYSVPNIRQINDIVHGLPGGKGIGTFIWEPTKWEGPALFDAKGNTKPEIDVYPELAGVYGKGER